MWAPYESVHIFDYFCPIVKLSIIIAFDNDFRSIDAIIVVFGHYFVHFISEIVISHKWILDSGQNIFTQDELRMMFSDFDKTLRAEIYINH